MAFARIKKHLWLYISVAIQIALGTGILYIALTMQLNAQRQFDELVSSAWNGIATITGRFWGYREDEAVTKEDYFNLRKELSNFDIPLIFEEKSFIRIDVNGTTQYIDVLFVSDNYHRIMMGMENAEAGAVYAGKNVMPLLSDGMEIYGVPIKEIKPLEGNRYNKTAQSAKEITYAVTFGRYDFIPFSYDDIIIVPIEISSPDIIRKYAFIHDY